MLARLDGLDTHALSRLLLLASTLQKSEDIERLPVMIADHEFSERFWARARRIASTITILAGAVILFWDRIGPIIYGAGQ